MAINNYVCPNCNKYIVCSRKDILEKFSEDAKKDLGIDITMESCDEYQEQK
jgi:hypothetical protein